MSKNSDLKEAMIRATAYALEAHIIKSIPRIEERLKDELYGLIRATKEFTALIEGPLDAHFGFEIGTAQSRIESIAKAAAQQVKVFPPNLLVSRSGFSGKIRIGFFEAGFKKLINMDEAKVFNAGTFEELHWLEWLLFNGDQIFIMSRIKPGQYWIMERPIKYGRSKKALMLKVTAKNQKTPWRVPTKYSGTKEDNWFIRSMMETIDITRAIIVRVIQEELG